MFIIVKYADQLDPEAEWFIGNSICGSYSANAVGIEKVQYNTKEDAVHDLKLLQDFNPTVGYGIVKGKE